MDVVRSQVNAVPMGGHFPFSGIGKAIFPAHSPSIAQAWVQSKGVAMVARKLALLLLSAVTHSSGDLLSAG